MFVHSMTALTVLAAGKDEHPGINPLVNALVAFFILVAMLFLVTRMNRDR